MAIGKFNSLTFGGIDSADYGIFISGEGVFNAPERAVEMIKVPGRNGAIALDQGRYENINIEYPSGTFGADQADFRVKLRQFVSALKAQIGYQRLSDTYHPDEYRMGIFIEAVEVEPANINTAGEFKLIFNCKPQRWLTSGEEEAVVSSGDDVINPTLFDAEPKFAIEGYGTFQFGAYNVDLHDPYRGETIVVEPKLYTGSLITPHESFNPLSVGNTDDTITIKPVTFYWYVVLDSSTGTVGNITITDYTGGLIGTTTIVSRSSRTVHLKTVVNAVNITSWSSMQDEDTQQVYHNITLGISYTDSGSHSESVRFKCGYDYWLETVDNDRIVNVNILARRNDSGITAFTALEERISTKGITVDSTVFILGTPTYVDCEIGECYMISNGEAVSLNDHIDLGSDLPKLKPGSNTFTIDNTITELTITPRWWQL